MELNRVLGGDLGLLMKKPAVSLLLEMMVGEDSGGQVDHKIVMNNLPEGVMRNQTLGADS